MSQLAQALVEMREADALALTRQMLGEGADANAILDECRQATALLVKAQAALLDLAGRHAADVMPGYTHLQRAQPVHPGVGAVAAVRDFAAYLEKDLAPRSNGSYAIGAENFARQLRYLAKVELFRNRASRWAITELGGIPLRRGESDRGERHVSRSAMRASR